MWRRGRWRRGRRAAARLAGPGGRAPSALSPIRWHELELGASSTCRLCLVTGVRAGSLFFFFVWARVWSPQTTPGVRDYDRSAVDPFGATPRPMDPMVAKRPVTRVCRVGATASPTGHPTADLTPNAWKGCDRIASPTGHPTADLTPNAWKGCELRAQVTNKTSRLPGES